MYVISIYSQKFAKSSDIEFNPSHPKYQTHMQQYFTKPGSLAKIKLLGSLFDSGSISNIISTDDPKIAKGHNDIAVILLALFMP